MESVQIPNDDDIQEASKAFASIIDPANKTSFVEDFEIGAKWMRRKMREAYELSPAPKPRKKKQTSS